MPMRWRWPPENSCGIAAGMLGQQADALEQLARPRASRRAPRRRARGSRSGSADDLADGHARVERGVGVLEDDLHAPAQRRSRVAGESGRCRCPRRRTRPPVGSIRRRTERPSVDLPQPDSPTRPASRRARSSKRDAVDGAHQPTDLAAEQAARIGKCLHQAVDLETGVGWRSRSCRLTSTGALRSTRRSMARRAMSRSGGGCSPAALRRANGQRGAKRQPAGRSAGSGTMPAMVGEPLVRVDVEARDRAAAGRACRGAAGRRRASSTGRALDDPAGIHHHDAVGDLGDDAEIVGDEQDRHAELAAAGRCSRSRICAWMVTSSAVVGSSAISSCGLAGQRHGDHDALAHAAGELVRIVVDALRRARGCRPARASRWRALAPARG